MRIITLKPPEQVGSGHDRRDRGGQFPDASTGIVRELILSCRPEALI